MQCDTETCPMQLHVHVWYPCLVLAIAMDYLHSWHSNAAGNLRRPYTKYLKNVTTYVNVHTVG